jgi:hypothetical protein
LFTSYLFALPWRAAVVSNLLIKSFIDYSISSVLLNVKRFIEILSNFFTTSRRSACGAGCPGHPADRPPAGDIDPRQPGAGEPGKSRKNKKKSIKRLTIKRL